MDTNFSPDDIAKQLEKLPAKLQEVIFGASTVASIEKIGKEHQLHIDQLGSLRAEITFLMMGLIPRDKFTASLMETLTISDEIAKAITEEVNLSIMLPFQEVMKKEMIAAPTSTPAQVSITTPSPQQTIHTMQQTLEQKPVAIPMPTQTPTAAPAAKPVSTLGSTLDAAMGKPSAAPAARVDVGIAPAPSKPAYKTDPYRELPQ